MSGRDSTAPERREGEFSDDEALFGDDAGDEGSCHKPCDGHEDDGDETDLKVDESDDEAMEAPEEAPVKRPVNPSDPTAKEREKHIKSHLPYRPCCPIRVGHEDPHYQTTSEEKESGLPKVSIDHAKTGEDDTEESNRTMLIGRDRWTKYTFSHLVTSGSSGRPGKASMPLGTRG